jgi:hypothetical protein
MRRPELLVALAGAAAMLAGCSLGAGDKTPPRPRGPVVAVLLDSVGQRRASIQADGAVEQAAADGHGGWFVSGQFRNIGGHDRGYLAHLDSDGDVDPDWDPRLDRAEGTITISARFAVGNGRVYLAGDFGSVDGKPRDGGAAVDAESGELDPRWAPRLGIVSDAIALTPDHVIVATGTHVDAYDPSSARRDPAFRLSAGPDDVEEAGVKALVVSGTHLYLGGRFRNVNGMPHTPLARVDARTGRLDRSWDPPLIAQAGCRACRGPVTGLAVTRSSVYAVGDFDRVGGARVPSRVAAFDAASGRVTAFRAPRPGRTYDGYTGDYEAVAPVGGRVFAGGEFGREPTRGFVTLDPRTGDLLPSSWHPARRQALIQRIVPSGAGALVAGDKIGP